MRPLRIRRRSDPDAAGLPAHLHPVLRRVYAARGIRTTAEIEHRLTRLAPPTSLVGIDRACELLTETIASNRQILVVGDFDADGATGTAVAVRGLRLLGARRVAHRVPNRFRHGYGLSLAFVESLEGQMPDLIVTVDNGIASHAGIAAAKARGVRVLVTDHHLPGDTLPDADAIVNPNRSPGHPLRNLCGVGVMFYVLLALRAHLREQRIFACIEERGQGRPLHDPRDQGDRKSTEPDLSRLLDLVALGTVADLVPLDFNNRVLVEAGLKRIRAGRAAAGVLALIEASGRDAGRLVASDLGFAVAPRINAAGRLEDMALGIECLLSDDPQQARALADRLSAINAERRELQTNMVEQAEAAVARWVAAHGHDALPVGLTLFEPDWHAGVVGLVASKLKERLHRPVVACAPAGDGSAEIRCSARSIPGFHVRDALAEVDARHPGLILRFGGHAMAAGLTLAAGRVADFSAAFDTVARERLAPEQLDAVLLTDGELAPGDLTLELAEQLRYAGPWGQAFPEPLFDGEFALADWRVVGEAHLRLRLACAGLAAPVEAVWFNGYDGTPPPSRLRAVYAPDVNEWNGMRRLQLLVRHIEAA